MTFHHRVAVDLHAGPLHIGVDFHLAAPWTLLFGPSGSGKSTILRAIAGLMQAPGIALHRTESHGTPTTLQASTVFTPPDRRAISWAPQQPSLFPHLSVRQNIAFPHGSAADTAAAIALFRLTPLLDRRPAQLSGGEQQRVNLARALCRPDTRLLLLDEPFSGTDRALRDELLPQLRDYLRTRKIPVLSVSHDVEEALLLNAEVIQIEAGRILAQGSALDVLAAERARILCSLA